MTVTWELALAECEARLDAAAAALEQGRGAAVAPFSAPDVEGPIPEYLAGRARVCSERGDQLQERLTGELQRLRAELRRLPRMPRMPREAHFDVQAGTPLRPRTSDPALTRGRLRPIRDQQSKPVGRRVR